jgi:hypothetical protein
MTKYVYVCDHVSRSECETKSQHGDKCFEITANAELGSNHKKIIIEFVKKLIAD